jgi:hypothetical protein
MDNALWSFSAPLLQRRELCSRTCRQLAHIGSVERRKQSRLLLTEILSYPTNAVRSRRNGDIALPAHPDFLSGGRSAQPI